MPGTNLHSISHLIQVIADYWLNLCFRSEGGACVFNTVIRGKPLNSGPEI